MSRDSPEMMTDVISSHNGRFEMIEIVNENLGGRLYDEPTIHPLLPVLVEQGPHQVSTHSTAELQHERELDEYLRQNVSESVDNGNQGTDYAAPHHPLTPAGFNSGLRAMTEAAETYDSARAPSSRMESTSQNGPSPVAMDSSCDINNPMPPILPPARRQDQISVRDVESGDTGLQPISSSTTHKIAR